jgi:hypothetical protein
MASSGTFFPIAAAGTTRAAPHSPFYLSCKITNSLKFCTPQALRAKGRYQEDHPLRSLNVLPTNTA